MSRIALLASVLALSGCTGAVIEDDQEGQSGQGKDRIEVALPCAALDPALADICRIAADFGRDKDDLEIVAEKREDGSWYFRYAVGKAAGQNQAVTRAQVEALAIEAQKQGLSDLAGKLRLLLGGM